MRSSPLAALVVAALSACNSTVDVVGSGSGAGSGGSSTAATGGAATSSSTGSAGSGGGPVDGGPSFDAGPPPPPPDSGLVCAGLGDACTACLSASCAGAWCDCRGNADCIPLLACTGTCGASDAACNQACVTAHADGISPVELLTGCAAASCPQACPGSTPLSTCNQCLFGECPAPMDACVANAECTAYLGCLKPCAGQPACIATCQSAHPGGLVDASEVSACASSDCLDACGS